MPLDKHWLGPTIYTWSDDQCKNIRTWVRDDLDACKGTCEKEDSCNAIIVKPATSNIVCDLRNCTLPVPAPCGQSCGMHVTELRGHYRASGKKQIDI